jgi:uncharacterized protein YbcI
MTGEITDQRETLYRDISRAMIHLTHEYTGRGPSRARTSINGNVVVCMLEDTLTKGELTLVKKGYSDTVLEMRFRFQQAMRDEAITEIEGLTGCRVTAFMSANHIEPDLAAEMFVLDGAPTSRTNGERPA